MNNTEIFEEGINVPAAPAKEEKQKVRRIGVYTMGISLVVIGTAILIGMFNPEFNLLLAAKLSPVILIVLGIEIIVSTTVFHKDKLKYDFWSGFICFLLVAFSITAAFLPILWRSYGPDREFTQRRIQNELQNDVYGSLKNISAVKSASVNFNFAGMDFNKDMTLADISENDYVYIYVDMEMPADKEEYAKDVRFCLDKLLALNVPYSHIDFRAEDKYEAYYISASGQFDFDDTQEEIAGKIAYRNSAPEPDDFEEDELDYEENAPAVTDATSVIEEPQPVE